MRAVKTVAGADKDKSYLALRSQSRAAVPELVSAESLRESCGENGCNWAVKMPKLSITYNRDLTRGYSDQQDGWRQEESHPVSVLPGQFKNPPFAPQKCP